MKTAIIFSDIEADGFWPSKIHCISLKIRGTEEVLRFTNMSFFCVWIKDFCSKHKVKWVFHNGLGYDVQHINRLLPFKIDPKDVIDTFVVSRLVNYQKYNTHSLEEIGKNLGILKGNYTEGWDEYTEEMGDYCDQDVLVTEAVFEMYYKQISDKAWADAMRLEHDTAWLCTTLKNNGFTFDKDTAEDLLAEIKDEMLELEAGFDEEFGSQLVEDRRLKARKTKDGEWYATVQKAIDEAPKVEITKDEVIVYTWRKFNPGSPRDRIDVLWEAGWKPTEKTKGHIKKLREVRKWM